MSHNSELTGTMTYNKLSWVRLIVQYATYLSFLITVAGGDRLTSKIYENLEADHFCFRRLNATHQVGCTSGISGNVGVVHVVDSPASFKWVVQDGPDSPYIAALVVEYFNMGNLTKLINSGRVTGVLVLQGSEYSGPSSGFSPDQSCPNENSGLYVDDLKDYAHCRQGNWNPDNPALGMLYHDWSVPISLITNDTQIENITRDCFEAFNEPINGTSRPWPLCAAEISSFMLGARDSPTCMRRGNKMTNMNPVNLCDPLGSRNVVTMLFPTSKDEPIQNRSVIVIAARMDAVSMFDGLAPGADSAVTGLVALFSIAQTLTTVKEEIRNAQGNNSKNVLFSIFNGESFDYIGSSRAVFDMERNKFPQESDGDADILAPLNKNHLSHFIELSQLSPQEEDTYFLHEDPVSIRNDPKVNETVEELIYILKKSTDELSYKPLDSALPPASFQRFLKRDLELPGLVIAGFEKQFGNRFYNGRFDTGENLDNRTAEYIRKISTSVSRTVYKLLTGKENSSLTANIDTIEDMLDCYLTNSSCLLFQQIIPPSKLELLSLFHTKPYSLYVNVGSSGRINTITAYTIYLMAYLTGEQLSNYDESNCTANGTSKVFEYDWMIGPNLTDSGVCVRSLVKYPIAVSPAYVLNDWQHKDYSTWTESVWQTFTLRIFLRPNRAVESLTLGLGFALFIISVFLVYSIDKRASLLFGSRSLATS